MKTDIDFNNLWMQQSVEPPQIETITANLASLKLKSLVKLLLVNLLMAVTITIMACIAYYFKPVFITTKIGLLLIVVSIVIFMVAYNQLIPFLKASSGNKAVTDYLASLIKLKRKQRFLQTTLLKCYFIGLSTGIFLYLYEYAALMPLTWAVICYALTIVWIAFNWFYIRPKVIAKEQNKWNSVIQSLERINSKI